MNNIFLAVCILIGFSASAQHSWNNLGGGEKLWIVLHPFSAKKAQRITKGALKDLDSLKSSNYFKGNTNSGSKADALRHTYWMALLSDKIGPRRAIWLGKAHERKNEKDFKKKAIEDGLLPDFMATQMDLRNNRIGSDLGAGCIVCSDLQLLKTCIDLLEEGELVYIKQNKKGEFLDNEDIVIPTNEWSGKWYNRRMMMPTDL